MIQTRLLFACAAWLSIFCLVVAAAQADDPLQRLQQLGQQGGDNPQQAGDPLQRLEQLGQQGGAAGQPLNNLPPLQTPDWLTPGTRIVYRGHISTQPSAHRRPDDPPEVTAAIGMHLYDVAAVTDTFVLASMENFLQQGANAGQLDLLGMNTIFIDQSQVIAGEAFFMHPQVLAQLQSGQGVQVQRGPFPFGNQSVDAVTITVRGQDVVVQQVYDAQSGLKLIDRRGTGPLRPGEMHNEFNRHTREMTEFVGIRRIEGPWMHHDWPQWATQVRQLTYQGQVVHSMQGITQTYPMQNVTRITERGDGWVRGSSTVTMQMPHNMPQQPPVENPFGHARAMLKGNWINPAALQQIQPGVIDRDPHTGAVLSYHSDGTVGVFTYQATAGSRILSAYNLQDGALQAIQFEQPQMFRTIQLQLTGRQ